MTIFLRKTLILNTITRKFATARVAQKMINFRREFLILDFKTGKFASARK